jgi:O-antigen/teichoic acid export membrane protein
MPAAFVLVGAQTMMQAYLTRLRKFTTLGLAQILQALTTPVVTLGLLLAAPASGETAAAGAVAGAVAALATMMASVRADFASRRNRGWRRVALVTARRFKVYPLYMTPYSLSAGLFERILQIVFSRFYSVAAFGAFSIARQLMTAPATLLAGSMRQVMFAHSAQETSAEARRSRVFRVLGVLLDGLAPSLAFALVWLAPLIRLLLPPAWSDVAQFAWWSLFPSSMLLLVGWLDRLMDVMGRQRLGVMLQGLSDAASIALALISPLLGLDVFGMVALLSIQLSIYYLVWLLILLRLLEAPGRDQLMLAGRAFVLFLVSVSIQAAIYNAFPPTYGAALATAALLLTLTLMVARVFPKFRSN